MQRNLETRLRQGSTQSDGSWHSNTTGWQSYLRKEKHTATKQKRIETEVSETRTTSSGSLLDNRLQKHNSNNEDNLIDIHDKNKNKKHGKELLFFLYELA